MNRLRAAYGVCAEVGVGDHCHYRLVVEEFHRMVGEQGYVDQCLRVRMPVYEGVGKVVGAFLGVHDVHRPEMVESRPYPDDLLRHLYGVAVLGVRARDEGVAPVSTIIIPK